MTTADQVLNRARSQIGVEERPSGSNKTPYTDWYGLQGPWCAMFVSWCMFMEGLPLNASTTKGFAFTPAGAAWFRSRGRWTTTPRPGHVVFFDFPGDGVNRISHVGFVESVRADGTIVTIEGNTDVRGGRTGGKVMRKARKIGIVGYGIPEYGTADKGEPEDEELMKHGDKAVHIRAAKQTVNAIIKDYRDEKGRSLDQDRKLDDLGWQYDDEFAHSVRYVLVRVLGVDEDNVAKGRQLHASQLTEMVRRTYLAK